MYDITVTVHPHSFVDTNKAIQYCTDLAINGYEYSPNTSLKRMEEVEEAIFSLPPVELVYNHYFSNGVYIREMIAPKGAVAIGHEHLTEHLNVILKGHFIIFGADGSKTEVVAPCTFKANPGRKLAYFLEETIWQNILPNPDNQEDVEKLEDMFVVKSETWKVNMNERKLECHSAQLLEQ